MPFIAKEVTPYHEKWEADRMVSRDVWLAAGRAGLLGIEIDEKYGGGGVQDYRYYLILDEELAMRGRHRARVRRAQRHQRPLHPAPGHAGAV